MDYCRKCKLKTKSTGIPKFIKKKKSWRRISICKVCGSEKNNISKSPEDIEIEELFKPARKEFKTRHFIQKGILDTLQSDLYAFYRPKGNLEDHAYNLRTKHELSDNEYKKLLRANHGYKYILVVIDVFSKYLWTFALKTKTGREVAEKFESLFKIHGAPKYLHVDKGKEFYNKDVKAVLEKYGTIMYSTGTVKKAAIVERVNRSLGDILKPIIYKTGVWVTALPKVTKQYNNTYHRTIKMKPSEVNKENEESLLKTVYDYEITKQDPKFEVGDRVRLSRLLNQFENKLKNNWTKEIYTVNKVLKSNVNYYKVNGIEEGIYEQELQLSKL